MVPVARCVAVLARRCTGARNMPEWQIRRPSKAIWIQGVFVSSTEARQAACNGAGLRLDARSSAAQAGLARWPSRGGPTLVCAAAPRMRARLRLALEEGAAARGELVPGHWCRLIALQEGGTVSRMSQGREGYIYPGTRARRGQWTGRVRWRRRARLQASTVPGQPVAAQLVLRQAISRALWRAWHIDKVPTYRAIRLICLQTGRRMRHDERHQ